MDVTDLAVWSVEPNGIASIDAGLLETEDIDKPQDVTITAEYTEGENTEIAQKDVSIFTICPSGTALDFDGVDDYVTLPDNNPIWLPQSDFTLSVWVYFERDVGYTEIILDLNYAASGDPTYELGYLIERAADTGKLWFQMTTTTNSDEDLFTDDILVKNTWYHIVAVRDGTTQAVYVNGQLEGSRTCSPDPIDFVGGYDDDRVNIGRYTTNIVTSALHLEGTIDEIMIYDRALSAEEVQQLYQNGLN